MAFSTVAITAAYAALTPIVATDNTSIKVVDLGGMPDAVETHHTPLLAPAPTFITNIGLEKVSQGSGLGAKINFSYNMNYRFFYRTVGMETRIAPIYAELVAATFGILSWVIDNDSAGGAIHLEPDTLSAFGTLKDPSDNLFWGCEIGIKVLEFLT